VSAMELTACIQAGPELSDGKLRVNNP
jgi:hypothetical protein